MKHVEIPRTRGISRSFQTQGLTFNADVKHSPDSRTALSRKIASTNACILTRAASYIINPAARVITSALINRRANRGSSGDVASQNREHNFPISQSGDAIITARAFHVLRSSLYASKVCTYVYRYIYRATN